MSRGSNNENFVSKTWDLKNYLGFEAQIRLVDYETGGWGHIHADRFVQSSVPASMVQEIPTPPFKELQRIANENDLSPNLLEAWCNHFKQEKSLFSTSKNFAKEKTYLLAFQGRKRTFCKTVFYSPISNQTKSHMDGIFRVRLSSQEVSN